jgi:hypothetical protein
MVHHHEIQYCRHDFPMKSQELMAQVTEVGPFGLRTLSWQEHGHGLRREAGPSLGCDCVLLWGYYGDFCICGTTWHVVFNM